jgi:Sec-independent protein translocase protein TatA/GNAT superfamily N-acetyltransferase
VFGISFEELIILAILAFILFGPEKLPEYAQTLGKFVAKLREAGSEVTRQYQNPFEPSPEPAPAPVPPPAPEPKSTCPYCQQEVAAHSTFCTNCGHRLHEDHYPPPAPESICPACQQEVTPNFIFCPSCGHRLHQDHYPPAPEPVTMIRPLRQDEIGPALAIINRAALAYKGVIPPDCWQEPYMPEEELRAEIAAGVEFAGYEAEGRLLGVMGRQDLGEVNLIRHAYVDPLAQRRGVGSELLTHLLAAAPGPVLVGTWAAAGWAIRFYEKHGFRLVSPEEKDRLLQTYWTISPRQIETSVVLADPKWLALAGIRDQGSETRG